MSHSFRPLPTPPGPTGYFNLERPMGSPDRVYPSDPYFGRYPYGPSTPRTPAPYHRDREEPPSTLPGGTLLHKGFYDLLSLIPTPSPSRFLQGWTQPPAVQVLAGPRYDQIGRPGTAAFGTPLSAATSPTVPTSPSSPSPKKGRRVSKDMVSKPTGFVYVRFPCLYDTPNAIRSHLVHASDADQLEAILTRWGPDRQGKLGGTYICANFS